MTVARVTVTPEVDFVHDVMPVLSRLGCNAGTCHGAQQGKNGFKLSLARIRPDLRRSRADRRSRLAPRQPGIAR